MFGVDWNDPQTLWLNLTNLGLGVAALICVGAVAWNVVREVIEQRRTSRAADHELKDMLAAQGHAMNLPDLGWTMADGGEPVPPPVFKTPPVSKKK